MSGTRIASISGLRGVVGDGLDPAAAVEFAAAYASGCVRGPIVVGHDGRASAPVFLNAVLAGVNATGREALLAGPVATPTLGHLVRELGAAGGIQISASHNPPEYNGLKFFQAGGMVLSPAEGKDLLVRLDRKEFDWARWDRLGQVRPLEHPYSAHLGAVLRAVDRDRIASKKYRVILDACHGAGGRPGGALLRALGCHATVLGAIPDGLYDHPPEPTEENLREVAAIVPAVGAAIGLAQDPDADRLALIDEKGRYIGEELTLALAALWRLTDQPGPLVLNLSTSRVAESVAQRLGCPALRTPVGEINVVERMLAEQAVLGGEGNGGVIDPRIGLVRDSLLGIAAVLDLMARESRPLSAIVDDLPVFHMVKRKYPIDPAQGPIAARFPRIAQAHAIARADYRDGLRLDWPDAWVHVRASNTEPIVRVIAEAADSARAEALADLIGRSIRDF
ncbi:MAG: phosphoglucosamine mutase [Isosphaeraceae bacterium]